MNDDKEKWMEEVFQSMKGSKRAVPRPEIFANIEKQIESSHTIVMPIYQWRHAVAAAVLLLFANVSALTYYNQQSIQSEDVAMVDTGYYGQSLISTFQIYE